MCARSGAMDGVIVVINSTDEVLAGRGKKTEDVWHLCHLESDITHCFSTQRQSTIFGSNSRKSFCNKNDEEDDQMMCKNAPAHSDTLEKRKKARKYF